ncbi:rod shape-determining protein MreD [Enterococcus sp. BWB1-3]|uniref:rod shape-determining protein MreD n=1 Tax=unclassified Enterococcus TaxID=2608891 RepID=UPI0019203E74|nr:MULTISPECIES: rod shape-determining protein MreD [unclassified Enterococcus]MBL1228656.1 rod shape-determining protein MreD [Enterococcus sp. BWB1-3]MCB5952727.1 rod shape-determining protein MreD [Enterococcus sp. BWT-B8]MCB5953642.1 rod shape-determining protein MreD [Enterococcus sp. CWB-B31]
MIPKDKVKYYAPFILFFLMLTDGQLTMWAENLVDNVYFPSAHFLLLAYVTMIPNLTKRYVIISSVILGLICDSYYIGVLGIYTVALTVTVVLMYTFQKVLDTNIPTAFFGMVIFVTCYELISVVLQMIFRLSNVGPIIFITRTLGPTLLFNMLLFVLFYYPLKKLFSTA